MSVLNLIRSELLEIPTYTGGANKTTLRLHANELPWSVIESDSLDLNFYPENEAKLQLQGELAKRYQVNQDEITLTRGSDDGIDLLMRLFLRAGQDAFMQFPPTFSMYTFYAQLQQAEIIECPLNEQDNFNLSLNRVNESWKENCRMIMLCNPNNPTGNLIDLELIAALCNFYKNRSVIVVDEAYMEFANGQSATCLIPQFDNLIVLRTLSKAYGLAGLRLGAVLAQAPLIRTLNKIMAPYPLSSVVIRLASQALANNNWFNKVKEKIKEARNTLINALGVFSYIEKIYPSEANFILIKTTYARELAAWLTSQGITIKSFPSNSELENHLRITVGNDQQNLLLKTSLSSFQNNISGF